MIKGLSSKLMADRGDRLPMNVLQLLSKVFLCEVQCKFIHIWKIHKWPLVNRCCPMPAQGRRSRGVRTTPSSSADNQLKRGGDRGTCESERCEQLIIQCQSWTRCLKDVVQFDSNNHIFWRSEAPYIWCPQPKCQHGKQLQQPKASSTRRGRRSCGMCLWKIVLFKNVPGFYCSIFLQILSVRITPPPPQRNANPGPQDEEDEVQILSVRPPPPTVQEATSGGRRLLGNDEDRNCVICQESK